MREGLHNEIIFSVFLFFISIFLLLLLIGCELRENAVIREQTETFTGEIRDKNQEMQLIANQLKVANEKNKKLEQMLLCREELTDEAVDQAKRDMLKTVPVLLPKKSNKAEAERNQ